MVTLLSYPDQCQGVCGHPGQCPRYTVTRQVSWPVSGGIQLPCRYPDQCPGSAGTLLVSWTVSGVYSYHAGILTSVWGIQLPCRYPSQCLGYTVTMQVSWPLSGVYSYYAGFLISVWGIQLPCRYPDKWNWPTECLTQRFPGCTHVHMERAWVGLLIQSRDPKPSRVLGKLKFLAEQGIDPVTTRLLLHSSSFRCADYRSQVWWCGMSSTVVSWDGPVSLYPPKSTASSCILVSSVSCIR